MLGIPYVVTMVAAALANYDHSLERASLSLGPLLCERSSKLHCHWHYCRSGFGILISFDNFSLSLFITQGNTLPLRLMQELLAYADPSIATNATLLSLFPIVGMNFLLPRAFRTRA